ncbi:MAG: FecR family protein [Ghiorsea sp.]
MLKVLQLVIITVIMVAFLPHNPAYAAANIGRIVYSYGPAWVQHGTKREEAKKGQVLLQNDSIITGSRGRVKIMMADGSKIYIGAKSRVSMRQYSLKGTKLLSAKINMLWGKARFFVNKLIARNSSFRVRTPTAVLGVRGTEFIVLVPPTPDLLERAFDDIGLSDMPPLPTVTVLAEGAVDVSGLGDNAQIEQLLPGNTANIDKGGRVIIRETSKDDANAPDITPTTGDVDKRQDIKARPEPPKIKEHIQPINRDDIRDKINNHLEETPQDTVNALQNLDNTTEIIIKPDFPTLQ